MNCVPNDSWSRKEKEDWAAKKMMEMKVKNEKVRKRHEEVEKDRMEAERNFSAVTVSSKAAEIENQETKTHAVKKVRDWDIGKNDWHESDQKKWLPKKEYSHNAESNWFHQKSYTRSRSPRRGHFDEKYKQNFDWKDKPPNYIKPGDNSKRNTYSDAHLHLSRTNYESSARERAPKLDSDKVWHDDGLNEVKHKRNRIENWVKSISDVQTWSENENKPDKSYGSVDKQKIRESSDKPHYAWGEDKDTAKREINYKKRYTRNEDKNYNYSTYKNTSNTGKDQLNKYNFNKKFAHSTRANQNNSNNKGNARYLDHGSSKVSNEDKYKSRAKNKASSGTWSDEEIIEHENKKGNWDDTDGTWCIEDKPKNYNLSAWDAMDVEEQDASAIWDQGTTSKCVEWNNEMSCEFDERKTKNMASNSWKSERETFSENRNRYKSTGSKSEKYENPNKNYEKRHSKCESDCEIVYEKKETKYGYKGKSTPENEEEAFDRSPINKYSWSSDPESVLPQEDQNREVSIRTKIDELCGPNKTDEKKESFCDSDCEIVFEKISTVCKAQNKVIEKDRQEYSQEAEAKPFFKAARINNEESDSVKNGCNKLDTNVDENEMKAMNITHPLQTDQKVKQKLKSHEINAEPWRNQPYNKEDTECDQEKSECKSFLSSDEGKERVITGETVKDFILEEQSLPVTESNSFKTFENTDKGLTVYERSETGVTHNEIEEEIIKGNVSTIEVLQEESIDKSEMRLQIVDCISITEEHFISINPEHVSSSKIIPSASFIDLVSPSSESVVSTESTEISETKQSSDPEKISSVLKFKNNTEFESAQLSTTPNLLERPLEEDTKEDVNAEMKNKNLLEGSVGKSHKEVKATEIEDDPDILYLHADESLSDFDDENYN